MSDIEGTHLRRVDGFTLVELTLAVLLIGLLVSFASINIEGVLNATRMDRDIHQFVGTLHKAAEQAVFRRETFIIEIEVMDGYYIVKRDPERKRRMTREDNDTLSEVLIPERQLEWSYIYEIEKENGQKQYSGDFEIRATPQGWDRSAIFVLTDEFDQVRYLRFDKLSTQVDFSRQPLELPEIRESVSMSSAI